MRPHLSRYRWRFAAVFALLPVSAGLAALVPYLTKVAVDDYLLPAVAAGELGALREPLLALVGLAGAVVVAGYLADALYVRILQRTGHELLSALRETVYRRTLRLPRSYFDRNPIGSVLTRVTSDVEALGESLAGHALSLIADLLKTAAFLAMMFWLSWKATLVLLAMLPVLLVVMDFFQRRVRSSFLWARRALSEATGYLQECLAGVKTVQLYAAEAKVLAAFERRNRRFYSAQNTSNLYDAMLYSLVEGLTSLGLAVVLWYSAGALLAGVMTIGVLVAFMEYIQRLFVPVRELAQQLAILQRALGALDHIGGLLAEPPDPAEPADPVESADRGELPKPAGPADPAEHGCRGPGGDAAPRFERLDLEGVRFRYAPHQPEVLRGIDLQVRRGETVAIVGATGSGKSSIVRLIARAYGGYEGSIRLNGEEITSFDADRIGRMVSVVHQNVFLFHGIRRVQHHPGPAGAGRGGAGGAPGAGGRVHPRAAGRLPLRGGARRGEPLRRSGPAHLVRPGGRGRRRARGAGRGDELGRLDDRGAHRAGPRPPLRDAHGHRDCAPPQHHPRGGPDRGARGGRGGGDGHPRRARPPRRRLRPPRGRDEAAYRPHVCDPGNAGIDRVDAARAGSPRSGGSRKRLNR